MLHPKSQERATIYDVVQHAWVNEGYSFAPLDFLEEPGTRRVQPIITSEFVSEIIHLNVCEAGSKLMDIIEEHGPLTRQKEVHSSLRSKNEIQNESIEDDETVTDKSQDVLQDMIQFSKPSKHQRIKTAGAKIKDWWIHLFSRMSRISKIHGHRESKAVKPKAWWTRKHARFATCA